MKTDPLGDKVKALENVANSQQFSSDAFLLARVDGRAFHTFTKGMAKPFDGWLLDAMITATTIVSVDLKPRLAYVQSDEATFSWRCSTGVDVLPFNGRVQKLCSLTAALFTAAFIDSLVKTNPNRYIELNRVPAFDCRIWEVPSYQDQYDAFTWREKDAVKNAVSTAACTVATARELAGLKHRERLDILKQRGFDWDGLPNSYKHGAYVRRMARFEEIDEITLAKIPATKRPASGTLVLRHDVRVDEQLLSIKQLDNVEGFFALGEEAQLRPL
jgi:tRNA(His) 5'-end guanylyltransferase